MLSCAKACSDCTGHPLLWPKARAATQSRLDQAHSYQWPCPADMQLVLPRSRGSFSRSWHAWCGLPNHAQAPAFPQESLETALRRRPSHKSSRFGFACSVRHQVVQQDTNMAEAAEQARLQGGPVAAVCMSCGKLCDEDFCRVFPRQLLPGGRNLPRHQVVNSDHGRIVVCTTKGHHAQQLV